MYPAVGARMAHPAFLQVPEYRRFHGSFLPRLFELLKHELETQPDGAHTYRVLPSGACVALWREAPSNLLVLRISRSEKFTTDRGPALFAAEVSTFAEQFGIHDWVRVEDPSAPGVAMLLYEPQVLL